MKAQEVTDLKWVGIDLHVHTPASNDYKGSRDSSEYLNIARRANEFGASAEARKGKGNGHGDRNPIGCVAFTDHNSVEGFRRYRQLQEETEKLSKGVRARAPENPLIPQLEKDQELLRSIRVLMGVEIKADPGIHVLVIFAESVEPDHIIPFLEQAYQRSYSDVSGNPTPTSRWTLRETLDKIQEQFPEKAFVVFPHVDSSGGVYEDLKDFPQVRIIALTHPVVRALSFNRQETREKLIGLFSQPDYHRSYPVALIQSSDFHGEEGPPIGQPRTEVFVREGKATFKSLREAFRERERVKCSIDFVAAEYQSLVRQQFVAKYASDQGVLRFREADYDRVAETICGMLNSKGGILELEGDVGSLGEGEFDWTSVRDELTAILRGRLEPPVGHFPFRSFRFSPGKMRILSLIFRSGRLRTTNGRAFIIENGCTRVATSLEIESIVSGNLSKRFAGRFESTLKEVSRESTLLSKLPRGIPLFLACQSVITARLPASIKVKQINPADDKGGDIGELVDELMDKELDAFAFGNPDGNTSLLRGSESPREREHYLRFTVRRAEVSDVIQQKCAWGKIDAPAIVVNFSGCIGLVEPGYIISATPAVLLELNDDWQNDMYSLLGWMKSSFFVWYCAVHLGYASPFMELQFQPYRIPLPKKEYSDFFGRMDELANGVISAEKDFMNEINRFKKKGTLDSEYLEKAARRHNTSVNKACLTIDKEVFNFLKLDKADTRFIAQTLRDINMTDFGFLEESETSRQDA